MIWFCWRVRPTRKPARQTLEYLIKWNNKLEVVLFLFKLTSSRSVLIFSSRLHKCVQNAGANV